MKYIKITLLCAAMSIICSFSANAQSLSDLFGGGSGGGNVVTNLLEGVFSSSKITVADMEGNWQANGPAVSFQSENLLQKAGGLAAAAAIESKLDPYYRQYGLNSAKVKIDKDGAFEINIKGLPLRGTIEATDTQGVFLFTFTAMGTMKIGSFNTYVQKTSSTMDLMFDATKLMKLMTTVANLTGGTMTKTVAKMLDSYDGLCVGFKLTRQGSSYSSGKTTGKTTGKTPGKTTGKTSGKTDSTKNSGNNSGKSGSESLLEQGLEFLRGLGN